MNISGFIAFAIGGLCLSSLLGGCAGALSDGMNDPLEPVNRKIFAFNHSLDRRTALPAAKFYKSAVPSPTRIGVHNFFSNLSEPVTMANDLLQGQFSRAGEAVCRFGVNTTWGVLGVFDRASEIGCHDHDEDFGQTLGYYGMPTGPYLVLPLTGPTLPRDLAGKIFVDHFFSPLGYVAYGGKYYVSIGVNALKTVDNRSRVIDKLKDIERDSIDYYATSRMLFLQKRAAQIDNLSPKDKRAVLAEAQEPKPAPEPKAEPAAPNPAANPAPAAQAATVRAAAHNQ